MHIIKMTETHWPDVERIYVEGIATGNATFQTEAPSWEEWDRSHVAHSRLVAIENDKVIGWAALSPVSSRCVYGGVGEVSVYVDGSTRGKGIGKKLLEALIAESERNGFWTLQSGIFPENIASIKAHETCGFRIIGTRERIGKMKGVWRDNLILERRSNKVGID